uniref:Uncharacterized protein n=1 Tax=Glossina palpalis gambiensis TaxID=67801 RepID=A0A1B0C3F4_9MUSC
PRFWAVEVELFSEEVLLLLTPIRKNFLIENLALVLLPGFDFGLSTVLWARTAVKFVTDAELVTDMSSHSFTDSTTVITTINGNVTGVWEAVTAGFTGRVSITFVGGGDLGRAGSFWIVSVFCSKLPSGSALPSGSPCNSRDFSVISFSLTDDSIGAGEEDFGISVLEGKRLQLLSLENLLSLVDVLVLTGMIFALDIFDSNLVLTNVWLEDGGLLPNGITFICKAANDFLIFSCASPNKFPLFILKSVLARVIRLNSTISSSSLIETFSSSSFAKFIKSSSSSDSSDHSPP